MANTRHKDVTWLLWPDAANRVTHDQIQCAVLMDLRDELKKLNALLHCGNFLRIPYYLDTIRKQTARRKKKRVKAVTRGH